MAQTPVCCVDHSQPGTKTIGGRWFCDEHYAKATYKRGGVWRSELIAVIGLLVFVAAVVGLDAAFKPQLGGAALLLVGVILALIPAGLWLAFFYQQDRLEPEPVSNVARMFVIGLALAGALGIPLTEQLFRVNEWLFRDTLTNILGSVFLTGAVEAFVVFATVRYFIFDSPEFDERTDGVIYATAAALGYATALNLQFILANGGADLGGAEIFVAEVALAQAAFGGLLGYFLGKAKLEQEPVWWLSVGLLVTATLNGLFNYLRNAVDPGTISTQSGGLPSFTGLLLAGGLAVIVAGVVYWLINRDIAHSLTGKHAASTEDPTIGDRQASLTTLGSFIVLLVIGALVWNNAVNGTTAFDTGGVKGAYPSYYSDGSTDADVLRVSDALGTGAEFRITSAPAEGATAAEVASQLAGERGTDYDIYKVQERAETQLKGKAAITQRFTVVSGGSLTGGAPEMWNGLDYILISGDNAVVVTLLASPEDLPNVEPLFARFVNSLSIP